MGDIVWPPDHIVALTAYAKAGCFSYLEIAALLNERFNAHYSRNAVLGKANRLGLGASRSRPQPKPQPVAAPRQPAAAPPRPGGRAVSSTAFAAPAPAPAALPALRHAEIEPRHLPFSELGHGECRYPYGEGPFTFCAHPVRDGASYCAGHAALVHGRGSASERAAAGFLAREAMR